MDEYRWSQAYRRFIKFIFDTNLQLFDPKLNNYE